MSKTGKIHRWEKSPRPYAGQPRVAAILKLASRPRGTTAAEAAERLGIQPHTVRSIFSRLGSRSDIRFDRVVEDDRGLVLRVRKAVER